MNKPRVTVQSSKILGRKVCGTSFESAKVAFGMAYRIVEDSYASPRERIRVFKILRPKVVED